MNATRIGIAQINPRIGDLERNFLLAYEYVRQALRAKVDLLIFPELSVIGYPPKDLLNNPDFVEAAVKCNAKWAELTSDNNLAILFGSIASIDVVGKNLINAAFLVENGRIISRQAKSLLPTYDVFDEDRYFSPADHRLCMLWRGIRLGVSICEDCWNDRTFWKKREYTLDPLEELHRSGVDVFVNISASPYALGKPEVRRKMLAHACSRFNTPMIYVNQVGGNDDVIYDGGSMVFDRFGQLNVEAPQFTEHFLCFDIKDDLTIVSGGIESPRCVPDKVEESAEISAALTLGLRDYASKCGFKTAVLGLSGGIDSAVTAVLAAQALGKKNVWGISMPSRYSSTGSRDDARLSADALGINFMTVPIEPMFNAYLEQLSSAFAGKKEDVTEENLQARIRGAILMAFSNKFGHLLLSTGNKSEVAMGYCTLYGDTNGGLAVISDLYKTKVYALAKWLNKTWDRAVIPEASITKPPSAELRPNQTDQDSLPPYAMLDEILRLYIEESKDFREIVGVTTFKPELIEKVLKTIFRNEYKRKQLPPGLRITKKAFGSGRVMPLAQGWQ